MAALAGAGLVLAAVASAWDGGLVAGSALLLLAYVVSLADDGSGFDRAAPVVAVALVAVVEVGSWSLELRDGAEERLLARVPTLAAVLGGSAATSALLLAVAGARLEAGLALWMLGALAALALLALVSGSARSPAGSRSQLP